MNSKDKKRRKRSLISSQGSICAICVKPMVYTDMTIDHILPVSLGGPDCLANLQLVHHICNQRKGNAVKW